MNLANDMFTRQEELAQMVVRLEARGASEAVDSTVGGSGGEIQAEMQAFCTNQCCSGPLTHTHTKAIVHIDSASEGMAQHDNSLLSPSARAGVDVVERVNYLEAGTDRQDASVTALVESLTELCAAGSPYPFPLAFLA